MNESRNWVDLFRSVQFKCCEKRHHTYSTAERRVPKLIPVLGSEPAGDVSHKPDGRLPLLPAVPAVTLATIKFRCLVNRGTMGVNSLLTRLLPDSVATAI